jgi:hypothetical protein
VLFVSLFLMTQLPNLHRELREIVAGTRVETSEFYGRVIYSPVHIDDLYGEIVGRHRFTMNRGLLIGSTQTTQYSPLQIASDFERAQNHLRFFAKAAEFDEWMIGIVVVGSYFPRLSLVESWIRDARRSLIPDRAKATFQRYDVDSLMISYFESIVM